MDGLENIPKDRPCVFVANHRSYYDIPLLLAGLEKPHGILAKEELEKIPLLNRWMKLLSLQCTVLPIWELMEIPLYSLVYREQGKRHYPLTLIVD